MEIISIYTVEYTASQTVIHYALLKRIDYDDLIIFAGGCQSNYEALMNAGANFASAPKRLLINIYDPVYVASILSTSSISTVIDLNVLLESGLFTDTDIGGLETRGKSRIIKPGY